MTKEIHNNNRCLDTKTLLLSDKRHSFSAILTILTGVLLTDSVLNAIAAMWVICILPCTICAHKI